MSVAVGAMGARRFSFDDLSAALPAQELSRRRQRRARSCPAERDGESEWSEDLPASPASSIRHDGSCNATEFETNASESHSSVPYTESYIYNTSETAMLLPSLVDDRDSCSSSVGTPLAAPLPSRGLNAAAAAFVPAAAVHHPPPPVLLSCYPVAPFQAHLNCDEHPPYSTIAGSALFHASSPEGSRVVQHAISVWPPQDVNAFFDEVFPHITTLMRDMTGCHVLQKLLECSTPHVRMGFVASLKGNMLDMSLQPHSCRMVQRVLELLDEPLSVELAQELEGHVLRCVQDQHGNHVIQKFVDLHPHRSAFIVRSFVGRVREVATHSYGCRVVQRILERCRSTEEVAGILDEILKHAPGLALDQYGNYVVQHVVRNGHHTFQHALTRKLAGHFAHMATHKFASNVVEKLLEHVEVARGAVLDELLHSTLPGCNMSDIAAVCMDPFGNYVVQKLLDVASEEQRQKLLTHLQDYLPVLGKAHHAKNLQHRLKTFLAGSDTGRRGRAGARQNAQVVHDYDQHRHMW